MDAGAVVVLVELRQLVRRCLDDLLPSDRDSDSDAPLRLALPCRCRPLAAVRVLLRQVVLAWFLLSHKNKGSAPAPSKRRTNASCKNIGSRDSDSGEEKSRIAYIGNVHLLLLVGGRAALGVQPDGFNLHGDRQQQKQEDGGGGQ